MAKNILAVAALVVACALVVADAESTAPSGRVNIAFFGATGSLVRAVELFILNLIFGTARRLFLACPSMFREARYSSNSRQ
jgi:hypothetical protein